ncbi:hypothetical protein RRG08_030413 [Elysia crispata]|uniref:Uncharacterized protein n=1 Tax=Elysia crispata TaxID=231223 RepID=A0AAE0YGB2_9GAST|nr:hypothetical protein RRG08_030413 [Elysia crispata]
MRVTSDGVGQRGCSHTTFFFTRSAYTTEVSLYYRGQPILQRSAYTTEVSLYYRGQPILQRQDLSDTIDGCKDHKTKMEKVIML